MNNSRHFFLLPTPIKIMLLGILVLGGLIVAALFNLIFSKIWGGIAVFQLQESLYQLDNKTLAYLKIVQIINHIFMFIVPALLFAYMINNNIFSYHRMDKKVDMFMLLACFASIIVSIPFVSFLLDLNDKLVLPDFLSAAEVWMRKTEESTMILTEALLKIDTVSALLFNLFAIAVIPAFSEELIFRGALQRLFHDAFKRPLIPILLSGIIFSAFHLQFFSFLPRVYLGILFAYVFWLTQNLWYPILLHFINNALTVMAYYFSNIGVINIDMTKNEISNKPIAIIISINLIVVIFFLWRHLQKKTVK